MKLQIDDNWRIESDAMCWHVQKYVGTYKSGKKSGAAKYVTVAYLSTLGDAVGHLAERMLRESDAASGREAVDAAKRIAKIITNALDAIPTFTISMTIDVGECADL